MDVIEAIRNSKVTPFVGAGLPSSIVLLDGKQCFPLWRSFLQQCISELELLGDRELMKLFEAEKFDELASAIQLKIEKPVWIRLLRRSFDRNYVEVSNDSLEPSRLVWAASQGLVITTNYDPSLRWAAPLGRANLRIKSLETSVTLTELLNHDRQNPVLWHLHGRIEHPNDIVLGSGGYSSLYGDTGEKRHNQALFCLRNLLATKSLLFVGFSLSDFALVSELKQVHDLFDESDQSHFLVCSKADFVAVKGRVTQAGISNLQLVQIDNYEEALVVFLKTISIQRTSSLAAAGSGRTNVAKYLRRRCRTVVAGSPEFQAAIRPILAENQPANSRLRLMEIASEASDKFEATVTMVLTLEYEGAVEKVTRVTDWKPEDPIQAANLSLLRAIALEKLNDLDAARATYKSIIDTEKIPADLKTSAQFNLAIVDEKQNVLPHFERWMVDRGRRLENGELLWLKAFSNHLIWCDRSGSEFEYGWLLEDALASEMVVASTGFAKTLLNWSNFSGKNLSEVERAEVERVAGRSSVNVRVSMLRNLQAVTEDASLASALRNSIESAVQSSNFDPVSLRL